jgi:quercetin dioxygenase-like cupin family protein
MRNSYIAFIVLIILSYTGAGTMAQEQIIRTPLLNKFIESRTVSAINATEITFPAGLKAPYHKHPCPVTGYVVSGTILMQIEGESEIVLHAGDIFLEPADKPVLHFDNYSNNEPARFIAFYLLNGEKDLIAILPGK